MPHIILAHTAARDVAEAAVGRRCLLYGPYILETTRTASSGCSANTNACDNHVDFDIPRK